MEMATSGLLGWQRRLVLLPPGAVVPAIVLRTLLGVRHRQFPRITVPPSVVPSSAVAGALMLPDDTRRERARP